MIDDPIKAGLGIMQMQPTLHDETDKEELFNNEKMLGIRKMVNEVKNIEEKLNEIKVKRTRDMLELKSLKSQRAKISLQKDGEIQIKKLSKLDEQISVLDSSVRFAPDTIKELEKMLVGEKSKLVLAARNELLDAQKITGEELVMLSKKLLSAVEKAVGLNQLLAAATIRYIELKKQTGVDTIGPKCCEPSKGYLPNLYGYLRLEFEEGKHCRQGSPIGLEI